MDEALAVAVVVVVVVVVVAMETHSKQKNIIHLTNKSTTSADVEDEKQK